MRKFFTIKTARRFERGFSVTEVLVGITLLTVSMMATGTVFMNTSQMTKTTRLIEAANLLTEQVLEQQMKCRSITENMTLTPHEAVSANYAANDPLNQQLEIQVNHNTVEANLDELNVQVFHLASNGNRARMLTEHSVLIAISSIANCEDIEE